MKYKIEIERGKDMYLSSSKNGKQWTSIPVEKRSDLIAIKDVIDQFLKTTEETPK